MKWAKKKQNNFNIYNVAFFFFKWKTPVDIIIKISMIWSTVIEHNILKLVILDHFLPFYQVKNPKNQNLKNEKICWRYHHFTRVPRIKTIWSAIPGMWSETVRIFCHFGPFFVLLPQHPLPPPNPLPPLPLMIPKIHILKQNWKKCLEILSFYIYMCIINEDHMIYHSWNIRCYRQVILGHFLPFQPSDNPENQNFRIKKNTWKYDHFKNVYHKWQS